MLKAVKNLGLVATSVNLQGPNGPVEVFPRPDAPIVAFQLEGWDQTPEDEAQGHKVLDGMETVGNAMADGEVSAGELGRLTMVLELPGGEVASVAAPFAEALIADMQDDGKINGSRLQDLAAPLLGGLLQALQR